MRNLLLCFVILGSSIVLSIGLSYAQDWDGNQKEMGLKRQEMEPLKDGFNAPKNLNENDTKKGMNLEKREMEIQKDEIQSQKKRLRDKATELKKKSEIYEQNLKDSQTPNSQISNEQLQKQYTEIIQGIEDLKVGQLQIERQEQEMKRREGTMADLERENAGAPLTRPSNQGPLPSNTAPSSSLPQLPVK